METSRFLGSFQIFCREERPDYAQASRQPCLLATEVFCESPTPLFLCVNSNHFPSAKSSWNREIEDLTVLLVGKMEQMFLLGKEQGVMEDNPSIREDKWPTAGKQGERERGRDPKKGQGWRTCWVPV